MVVIEMNPRVSRSSALASKATGFPIAKIAARLAVGYTLDEIPNDITRKTPASFEPTIDYVVTKVPRWAFEKFPGTRRVLGTQMQSVGEAMAIGRTFPESLQKALRSLEHGRLGLNCDPGEARARRPDDDELRGAGRPSRTPDRPFQLEAALRRGITVDAPRRGARGRPVVPRPDPDDHRGARPPRAHRPRRHGPRRRGAGPSASASRDAQLAYLWERRRGRRSAPPASPPACGPRSRPSTPAPPSSRPRRRTTTRPTRTRTRSARATGRKVVILGSGPNRIGQGIEFDYCCVHASFALRDAGFETIMVNCNPETVSTDYDTSDRLYFEPLTLEDVLNVIEAEQASGTLVGVIVALGGQTPLKLARPTCPTGWCSAPARRRSTWPRTATGGTPCAPGSRSPSRPAAPPRPSTTRSPSSARIGYPVLVRPTYVLGGRAMEIVYDDDDLEQAMAELAGFGSLGREGGLSAERPVLVDRFLEDATEVDVDAIRDATGEVVIGGGHGARRGGRRALRRLRLRDPAVLAVARDDRGDRGPHPAHRRRARRPRPHQRAVRGQGQPGVRDRGQPARLAHRAVRGQGHRRAAGQGRRPGDARRHPRRAARRGPARAAGRRRPRRGEGGGAAVQPLPRRRPRARAGDALDRRGHGHRPTFGLAFAKSQIAAGDRLPEQGTVFISLADRTRRSASRPPASFVRARLRDRRHRRHRRRASRTAGVDGQEPPWPSSGRGGHDGRRPHRGGRGRPGRQQPAGRGPRADGATSAPRPASPASRASPPRPPGSPRPTAWPTGPCHELRVRPLQEYHAGRERAPTTSSSCSSDLDAPGAAASELARPVPRRTSAPRSARWRCPTR